MGKFAAVYDLPGDEQLLICVVAARGQEPFFQMSTEIHGVQTSVNMPITTKEGNSDKLVNLKHAELKELGVAYLEQMTNENLIHLRVMMVRALAEQQAPVPGKTKEESLVVN